MDFDVGNGLKQLSQLVLGIGHQVLVVKVEGSLNAKVLVNSVDDSRNLLVEIGKGFVSKNPMTSTAAFVESLVAADGIVIEAPHFLHFAFFPAASSGALSCDLQFGHFT